MESKSILEILFYLNTRVKELAYVDLIPFLNDCILDTKRLANDEEVSQILFDTITFGGLYVNSDLNTTKFTVEILSQIADDNFELDYCKEKLADEINIHKQTLNKWLFVFDKDLYLKLYNERKFSFSHLYQIIVALGFNKSKEIINRKELAERCNLKPLELRNSLPKELLVIYKKFGKYPPIFIDRVLNHLGGY